MAASKTFSGEILSRMARRLAVQIPIAKPTARSKPYQWMWRGPIEKAILCTRRKEGRCDGTGLQDQGFRIDDLSLVIEDWVLRREGRSWRAGERSTLNSKRSTLK